MTANLVAGYVPALAKDGAEGIQSAPTSTEQNIEGAVSITLRSNGKNYPLRIGPRTTLLDCVRESVAFRSHTLDQKDCIS